MFLNKYIPSIFLLIISNPLQAYSGVIALNAGPSWYQVGNTQSLMLEPGFTNTYVANQPTHSLASWELFGGTMHPLTPTTSIQWGLALASHSPAKLQGNIWETGDAEFNNFVYQYSIKHKHVALKAKLLSAIFSQNTQPYVNGSIGVGFNKSYRFMTTPTLFEAFTPPAFQFHQVTAFTYTVGTGIQKIFNPHWQAGMGYEFADWGKSSLATAMGQTIGHGPQLNALCTHELQLNLTYVI